MRLGLKLGDWGIGDPAAALELARAAEDRGYAVAWVAEAWGTDAPSVLGWLAAQTSRIDLGAGVMAIAARTPVTTAMTAATLDLISSGRFRLGLGVSGPQVSEGWHGVPFADPIGRTREYVEVVRMALRREPVRHDGAHVRLPSGGAPALRLGVAGPRRSPPIYLAALGPRNLRLAGEVADGWLAVFLAPEHAADSLAAIAEGRRWAGVSTDGFDVDATVALCVDDDLTAAVDRMRPHYALYLGGMGSADRNFYADLARRTGFADAADDVQRLYLAGDRAAAAAAVPAEFVELTSLAGPPARIADRVQAYAESGVTTLTVRPFARDTDAAISMITAAVHAAERAGVLS